MERRICEAAIQGDVISLLNLLQEDALVLDRFTVGCYSETPLHIAAMLGHLEFVQEILIRKPELAGELDARKSSPLHLAAAKGNLDIVKVLVPVKREMCFARDGDGRNPLHIATVNGRISVLRELVNVRPYAARILTDRGETILHLCVRYCQLETLKFLVETIVDDDGSLHSKCDDDGNTILHIAAANKQVEAVEFLTTNTATEVNTLNANGFTALDISTRLSRKHVEDLEIAGLLRRSGAMHAHELGTAQMARTLTRHGNHPTNTSQPQNRVSRNVNENVKRNKWLKQMSSALMIVASLIATMAFQVIVNPPGGVWQENFPKGAPAPGASESVPQADRLSILAENYKILNSLFCARGESESLPHVAGSSILAHNCPSLYSAFLAFSTLGFLASLSIILLLISGLPMRRKFFMGILMVIMWISVTSIAITYTFSVIALTILDQSNQLVGFSYAAIVIPVWFGFIGILFVCHIIRLGVKIVKYIRKSNKATKESF